MDEHYVTWPNFAVILVVSLLASFLFLSLDEVSGFTREEGLHILNGGVQDASQSLLGIECDMGSNHDVVPALKNMVTHQELQLLLSSWLLQEFLLML